MANAWTEYEIEYLYEHVGLQRIDTIASNLDKTVNAVALKLDKLNMGNTRGQTGMLTMGELSKLLGVDRKTVENWANNHSLIYRIRRTRKTKRFFLIDPLDFWEWAYEHQERIDFSKIEPHSIPPEPEWVKEQRVCKKKVNGNYYRPWTTAEEDYVFNMRTSGVACKLIAAEVDRTPASVEKKYKRLVKEKSMDTL